MYPFRVLLKHCEQLDALNRRDLAIVLLALGDSSRRLEQLMRCSWVAPSVNSKPHRSPTSYMLPSPSNFSLRDRYTLEGVWYTRGWRNKFLLAWLGLSTIYAWSLNLDECHSGLRRFLQQVRKRGMGTFPYTSRLVQEAATMSQLGSHGV